MFFLCFLGSRIRSICIRNGPIKFFILVPVNRKDQQGNIEPHTPTGLDPTTAQMMKTLVNNTLQKMMMFVGVAMMIKISF